MNAFPHYSYDYLCSKPSYLYKDKIDDLVGDLRKKFGITFFYFQRWHSSDIVLHIVGDRKWQLRYLSEYYVHDSLQKSETIEDKDYYLWGFTSGSKTEEIMHQERTEVYAIPAGISFIRTHGKFTDTFSYSSNILQSPIEEILKFNPKLIEWERFFIREISFILNEIKISSDKNLVFPYEPLTKKEILSIDLLSKDMETSQISNILCVTPKTTQKIIDSAKIKLDCKTRTGLVAKAANLHLISIIDKI